MSMRERLKTTFPDVFEEMKQRKKPVEKHIPAKCENEYLYVTASNAGVSQGLLGQTLSVEEGCRAARECAIRLLENIAESLGSLDAVKAVVRCTVLVTSDAHFGELDIVADAFSDTLIEFLGSRGIHVRTVLGATALEKAATVAADAFVLVR